MTVTPAHRPGAALLVATLTGVLALSTAIAAVLMLALG